MAWFKKKNPCIHCKDKKTRREFEGNPTCGDCEIELRMKREEIRRCPVDGQDMKKEQFKDIIIDRCPLCKGVWLDGDELSAIQAAEDEQLATGVALGMMFS